MKLLPKRSYCNDCYFLHLFDFLSNHGAVWQICRMAVQPLTALPWQETIPLLLEHHPGRDHLPFIPLLRASRLNFKNLHLGLHKGSCDDLMYHDELGLGINGMPQFTIQTIHERAGALISEQGNLVGEIAVIVVETRYLSGPR